jgi:hypothetical protein
MSVAEDNFAVALLRLRQCRRELRTLAGLCQDFTAVARLEDAFRTLEGELERFAWCQFGIEPAEESRPPRRKGKAR